MVIAAIRRQDNMAQARSIYRAARISPAKVRPLARLIRGKKAAAALNILLFNRTKAAVPLRKTLQSAVANVEHNLGENADDFFIRTVSVTDAPVFKRIKMRAKGRSDRILKRSCHIFMELHD